MMRRSFKLLLWVGLYLAVGFGIGQMTQGSIDTWYQALNKPSFNPPNWIFPVMWSILYVMTAIAGWRLWDVSAPKNLKLIFIVYTLMNWAWTPIFFGLHQIELAFFWIVALSVLNALFIYKAWPMVRLSAVLVVPLLCWTTFAGVLNYMIWTLNS